MKAWSVAESGGFHLHRPKAPLPGPKDFDPCQGDLDARYAWTNFGELSLDQAYRLFLENPEHYQEDFMFMGPVAFDYYFPVVDRHLRTFRGADNEEESCAWILGCGVVAQIENCNPRPLGHGTVGEIADLAAFVVGRIDRFAFDPSDQKRILKKWCEIQRLAEKRLSAP